MFAILMSVFILFCLLCLAFVLLTVELLSDVALLFLQRESTSPFSEEVPISTNPPSPRSDWFFVTRSDSGYEARGEFSDVIHGKSVHGRFMKSCSVKASK